MDYSSVKSVHVVLAIFSVILYVVRAGASINNSWIPSKAYRVMTHLIDTLLLGFGVSLAYMLSITPFTSPWFAWKLVAIVAYVLCGLVVMKGKTKQIKEVAMILSLALIVYILALAVNKDPYQLRFF